MIQNQDAIKDDEWEDIVDRLDVKGIKSMDRMYCELEQSYDKFVDRNENNHEK